MFNQESTIKFFQSNWKQLFAGIGIAGVIIGITVVTTKTDDLSSNKQQTAASRQTLADSRIERNNIHSTSSSINTRSTPTPTTSSSTPQSDTKNSADPYEVAITAESAIVWNMETKEVLFSKQSNKEQPLASLTKLMTALVAANRADNSASTSTAISRQHLEAVGSNGLVAGQSWNIYDLISFMLVESSNDAARAVAAAGSDDQSDGYAKDFIDDMNNMARTLGLESTYFFNPSGLDLNETLVSGGYGSAQDIALLFDHILHRDQQILSPTTESRHTFRSIGGQIYTAENTNTWLSNFTDVLGSKTGYTVLAGGNLVMGFDLKQPVVIVVMGSTKNGRFQDMQTLYNATQKHFSQHLNIRNRVTSP